jgi:signal transduction histidine kinase
MAIVGQMTVTLAHEIRNPLSSIKFAAKSISETNREKYKLIIVEEVERLNRLVTDLLDYGKAVKPNLDVFSVRDLVEKCVEKLQLIPDNNEIDFISDFKSEFKVSIDKELMTQVFLNLMMNSIQAMKGKGKIIISEIDEMTLSFEDSGPGIQADDISKIFQPFFTTKTEGSGLGLSVVKRILDSMEAEILFDQNFTQGAKFNIHFRNI